MLEDCPSLLVIGGTGFIGKFVVKEAVTRKYKVTVISLNKPAIENQILNVEYLSADIKNLKELQGVLEEKDFHYVINLGGYIDHSNFLNGGREVMNAHYLSVLNILEVINWKALKSFVQIGSSNEYGDIKPPQKEDSKERPISPYSLAKVAASQTLQMLHKVNDFPAIVVRIFLVYGPGQGNERFIPQIIEGCIEDREFKTSSGHQINDFTYVEDISEGLMDLMLCPEAIGEVVNLASGEPVRIRSIIEKVNKLVGKGTPVFGTLDRSENNRNLYADTAKIKSLIKWEPKITLSEGLQKTIDSYHDKGF